MSKRDFLAAIKRLGYTPHDAHQLLGISRSSAFRIAAGTSKVPAVVAKLLEMYERHGVPK